MYDAPVVCVAHGGGDLKEVSQERAKVRFVRAVEELTE